METPDFIEEQSEKESLTKLFKSPVAFHAPLAEIAGGALAGLFLSQLFYWTDKGRLEGGWIYKDWKEWQKETCMTEDEQRGARKKLQEKGLIEISNLRDLKVDKFKTTLAFRINFKAVNDALKARNPRDGNTPPRDGNAQPRDGDNPLRDGVTPHQDGNSPLLSTESTPEISSQISSKISSPPPIAPRAQAGKEGGQDLHESKNQDPSPEEVVEATRWAMRGSKQPMGLGLEHKIRMRWSGGRAGGEHRETDLSTVARYRLAVQESERNVNNAEAIAKRNSQKGLGVANLEGRRFRRCDGSGVEYDGLRVGIIIGGKITPTEAVLKMIEDGSLTEIEEVA